MGHGYCQNVVQDGPNCIQITCPDATCQERVTEREIRISAPELLERFQTFQLRNFVDSNASTRWCPGKGCERIAYNQRPLANNCNVANCDSCSISFCISCGEEPHDPCGCKRLELWRQKCKNDSETANWMTANTKTCPKCSARIEKNGGCMYITCQKCKHGFCWICMGTHHVSTCNEFVEEGKNLNRSKAKGELERYLHYYVRYDGHAKSQKIAQKKIEKLEEIDNCTIETSAEDYEMWRDVGFLKEANRQLIQCRRVLKYTYAFAFYKFLDPSTKHQKQFFEHHQGILEGLTERLTESSERSLSEIDEVQIKNQTRVIGIHLEKLLEYIHNE